MVQISSLEESMIRSQVGQILEGGKDTSQVKYKIGILESLLMANRQKEVKVNLETYLKSVFDANKEKTQKKLQVPKKVNKMTRGLEFQKSIEKRLANITLNEKLPELDGEI